MVQIATQFVEGVTEFHTTYMNRVQNLFSLHPLFIAALDKASCCQHLFYLFFFQQLMKSILSEQNCVALILLRTFR